MIPRRIFFALAALLLAIYTILSASYIRLGPNDMPFPVSNQISESIQPGFDILPVGLSGLLVFLGHPFRWFCCKD